jgi:2-polyprenyl-3-methyl-5-hydroxy-6-metoxy-1,4-benzoquinol methylase
MKLDPTKGNFSAGSALLLSAIDQGSRSPRRFLAWLKLRLGPFDHLIEKVPAEASVLDVGCGFGVFLGSLAVSGKPIRGLGFDRNALGIGQARDMAARLKAMGCQAELQFECRDIVDPWPEGVFDVVTIVDVIHHLPIAMRPSMLSRASTRLRPGGLVLLKDISPRPLWQAYANRLSDLAMYLSWVRYSSPEEMISWGRDSGLELLTREKIDRMCYGHSLMVFRRT